MADKPHPLADLYNQTHKARLLRALIDRPAGYTVEELVAKLFGADDPHALQLLYTTVASLRVDLPAGWFIPRFHGPAGSRSRRYQLIKDQEADNAA